MNNKIWIVLFAALTAAACGGPDRDGATESGGEGVAANMPAASIDLEPLLAAPSRAEEDRARDEGRRPAGVIAFLGIAPGSDVIDIIAAGGYYTEVLSLAVGPDGHVVAQNPPRVLEFRDGANEKALSARLAGGRLPNVTRLDKDFGELGPDDGRFDAAITALNFHDIYNNAGPDGAIGALQAISAVLKPGAVFGIIDHVGNADADNASLHRIEKSRVIETAAAAGFIVEDESDLLSNDTDDHTQTVFSDGVRGKTDRFLLKLRKPAG